MYLYLRRGPIEVVYNWVARSAELLNQQQHWLQQQQQLQKKNKTYCKLINKLLADTVQKWPTISVTSKWALFCCPSSSLSACMRSSSSSLLWLWFACMTHQIHFSSKNLCNLLAEISSNNSWLQIDINWCCLHLSYIIAPSRSHTHARSHLSQLIVVNINNGNYFMFFLFFCNLFNSFCFVSFV